MPSPKIKYVKDKKGNIIYPRTISKAIMFEDGENLDTKAGNLKPIASEEEALTGYSNSVLMTPLRTKQMIDYHNITSFNAEYDEENKMLHLKSKPSTSTGGSSGGLTTPQINSLWSLMQKMSFAQVVSKEELDYFKATWGVKTSEDLTEKDVVSITVTYTGGEVEEATPLTDLEGITVKAKLTDGSTMTVQEYTLSGEIKVGVNIITVTFKGKKATFSVTGVGNQTPSNELPTEGLLDFFDLRTCSYDNNKNNTALTTISPSSDNTKGQLYAWLQSMVNTQSEYGMKLSRAFLYDKDGGTDQSTLGSTYTVATLGYTSGAYGGYMYSTGFTGSNLTIAGLRPSYTNTSDSSVKVTQESYGNSRPSGYHTFITVVDNNIMKQYVDGVLAKTWDGNDYDDFKEWESQVKIENTDSLTGMCTALAVYNKALSDIEVTDIQAFLESLEVK